MLDTYRHKGLRKKLVETIRLKGVTDENVLTAIEKVPRHWFMDSSFLEFAYEDKAFPIAVGQTISQPYTVAYMTELLELKKGDKVLEIGTGSGYQACVLSAAGAKVFTIERHKILHEKSKIFLPSIGFGTIKQFYGDGYKGLPTYGPFDKIIVTCGAPYIPESLITQLKIGGKMVIPVGEGNTQVMQSVTRLTETENRIIDHGLFRFVPMLENRNEK
ncbi:MAG: protein-L-isoaspartate(D-aspartate) O-methyltransferase [Bacteroidetes bacterium]|nr:protein-L-isoaspartate(D-aspartate) O-methyltransferase [Bacteroidota bacterium]